MDTLTKILSVAVDSFRQYGFKTITMDDIARKAGISKKTLYQHFPSKPDVVIAAMEWHHEHMDTLITRLMEDAENAVEAMVRVNAVLSQVFRQINPVALLELERFFPDGYRQFKEKHIQKDIAKIRDNIIRGMKEGVYRAGMDADLLACFRIESCLILFQPNSITAKIHPPHVATQVIMENFLYGLMTPKGEKLYQKYSEKYLKEVPRI
jgi:AcrR family transcriptional regulator